MLWLAVPAMAGLHAGPSAARGPERTLSSDLVVDGARPPAQPVRGRRTQRQAPRLRPFAVNVVRNVVHGVTHAGRTVLAGNRLDDLRRRWRSRPALRKLS